MSAADWWVAMDDGLCHRLRSCTLCGGAPGAHGWWDIMKSDTHAVAVLVCGKCRASDPERTALTALLERRYATGMG